MDQEEINHEREKLLAQARLQKSSMVRLLDSTDWKTLASELQAQIDRRFLEMLTMPLGADDVIKKTYIAGELAGLKVALDYPQVLIDYAQSSIDSARIQEENVHGQETKPDAGAGNAGRTSFELDDDYDNTDFAGRGRSAP